MTQLNNQSQMIRRAENP